MDFEIRSLAATLRTAWCGKPSALSRYRISPPGSAIGKRLTLRRTAGPDGQTSCVCSRQNLPSEAWPGNESKVPAFAIPRLLVETSTGHERVSEVGVRATTAEYRIVGLNPPRPSDELGVVSTYYPALPPGILAVLAGSGPAATLCPDVRLDKHLLESASPPTKQPIVSQSLAPSVMPVLPEIDSHDVRHRQMCRFAS